MKRRAFITLLGGAAVGLPLAAQAQQSAMPIIGFLQAGSPGPSAAYISVFRQVLAEAGYVENQNVRIEYRYAEGQYDRLPELAADLVRRQVAVIVVTPNTSAARAVEAATSTIPIVFIVTDDPVKLGLVASLNRPGGNATGVNSFFSELGAKRLGLLRELLPAAARVGALVNPNEATTETFIKDLTAAASAIGVQLEVAQARDSREIEAAFAMLVRNKADGLMVAPDTFFAHRSVQIVTLATRHAIPAIYTVREYVNHGGLMSYGPSVPLCIVSLLSTRVAFSRAANLLTCPSFSPPTSTSSSICRLPERSASRCRQRCSPKRGNGYLRMPLIHGARTALPGLAKKDTPLGRWVKALLARAHRNVVTVALANKLARIAWAVLARDRQYVTVQAIGK